MISIVIIVKNDRNIEDTLNHLIMVTKPEESEIIVVDASEKTLLADIKERYKSIKWIYFENKKNRRYTIPEQRNTGILNLQGDIITFIDANCVPEKDWLVELVKPIRKENEFIVAGQTKSKNTTTINDLTIRKNANKKYLDEFYTINLAFKKEITDKIGMFDDYFDYGSDVDYSWRAIDLGYKIRYNKNAIIYHDWGNLRQEIKRVFRYGEARVRLYKKHLHRWKNLFSHDIIVLIYPLYIIFLPLTFLWPYYPLLIFVPIIKNINRQPLKVVFMHLIYGFGALKELFFPNKT